MRYTILAWALGLISAAGCTARIESAPGSRFSVSFPQSFSATPLDGRVVLLLSKDLSREPRTHVADDEMLATPYVFGINVEGLAPGQAAVVDDHAFGWPAARLADLPAGDYYVQAVLNRYETFHLADGRTLKLPPDQGEGQQWATKPGNLYSKPTKLHVDAAHLQSFNNAYSRLHYNYMYLPIILERIKATAPKGADLTSWRYP